MGSVISGILGSSNDFRADTGGQSFANNLASTRGGLNQNFNNQNTLAKMLMEQANGSGANPAQNMLNQATDRNIKTTASTIASQKGINPGLAQRLIAMNGADQQQQANAQAATMGAQQQLAAQGQAANVYGQIGNQQVGVLNSDQNALANANSVNAGVTNANTAGANGLVGGLLGGVGSVLASKGVLNKFDGGKIEGSAPVPGDSPKNDIVNAKLSPGEIVIPRSKASDPVKAKKFIDHIMQGQKPSGDEELDYGMILKLKNRVAQLEKKVGKK